MLAALLWIAALDARPPCADSAFSAVESEAFWFEEGWGPPALEPCDPETDRLFASPERVAAARDAERAAFSLTRSPSRGLEAATRHEARRNGWRHRLEVRGNPGDQRLERRELAWQGRGAREDWRFALGDLVDPALPAIAPGLPRRTLPAGWISARERSGAGAAASARPQGLAAGVSGNGWSAYAARAWNPVETGREPLWAEPWSLTHLSAGLALEWAHASPSFGVHFEETRVSRGDVDTLSQRLLAARLGSPPLSRAQPTRWSLQAALLETRAATEPAWMAGLEAGHRFGARSRVETSWRQRGGAWTSAWDPAVAKGAAPSEGLLGAGEYRLVAAWAENAREGPALRGESWAAWNPPAGTWREGLRAGAHQTFDGLRLDLSGTRRATRAASGSTTRHRALEIEGRVLENPRWRSRAWRAWNANGPTATGVFFGAEPDWNGVRAEAGVWLEADRRDRLKTRALGGLRWAFARGWSLEAGGARPLSGGRGEGPRWRVSVRFNASRRSAPDEEDETELE